MQSHICISYARNGGKQNQRAKSRKTKNQKARKMMLLHTTVSEYDVFPDGLPDFYRGQQFLRVKQHIKQSKSELTDRIITDPAYYVGKTKQITAD
jgi:hypothetical protein